MTCIVALKEGSGCWFAADTEFTLGNTVKGDDALPKVVRVGPAACGEGGPDSRPFVLGLAGDGAYRARVLDLADLAAVTNDPIASVSGVLGGKGWPDTVNVELLVFDGARLVTINQHGAECERANVPFDAIGGGDQCALGSLYSSTRSPSAIRVFQAVQAAITFRCGCGGQVRVWFVDAQCNMTEQTGMG